jgi:O-acetyl-ADP-ribose deacetylase (regulator of RNase III)
MNKNINIINGDLLTQDVDVIVNPWNRNLIPWWLLIPQGVSGAIKKNAGIAPFIELSQYGLISLGEAITTSSGKLNYKSIIHVAGIDMFWKASNYSISKSIFSAMNIVNIKQYSSIAFPLIGSGSGGFSEKNSTEIIINTLYKIDFNATVNIIKYTKVS